MTCPLYFLLYDFSLILQILTLHQLPLLHFPVPFLIRKLPDQYYPLSSPLLSKL